MIIWHSGPRPVRSWPELLELAGLAAAQTQVHGPGPVTNRARLAGETADRGDLQLAAGPVDVELEAATGAKALDEPLGQAWGRVGKSSISPAWLCSSISAMPDAPPKLPSIWNGGCASNMLG